jgi:hypothetical protein
MGKNPEPGLYLQASQILLGARDLVSRGWSRGAAARDRDGRAVNPLHPSARSWSLAGALKAADVARIDGWNDEKEERARAIAEAALATAVARDASETEALRDLNHAIRETALIAGGRIQTPMLQTDESRVTPDTQVADGANRGARCGVCMRELAQEGLHLQTAVRTLGSFCSQGCLAAAAALAALELWAWELDGHGRRDEAQTRGALADQLLFLWRRRIGPDPKIVGRAVRLARERDALDRKRGAG